MKSLARLSFGCLMLAGLVLASALATGNGRAAGPPRAQQARLCSLSSSTRPSLDPQPPPGVNPLTGARFFVDGPGTNRGFAASAIAHEIGRSANSFGSISWPAFRRYVDSRRLSPGVAH